MTGIDHAGWYIVGCIVAMLIGGILQRFLGKNDCSTCGVVDLAQEITRLREELAGKLVQHRIELARLCVLVRALAERAGMSVKEQLELESLEPRGE